MKKQRPYLVLILMLCCNALLEAQTIKDFFYIEEDTKELPIFVRGNLDNKTIILFVQGGPGETAIDFGRSDYPRWKNNLEKKVAIAYYDQLGLNQKAKRIDTTRISYKQYSKDILEISKRLKEKYQAKIYLMGHSYGGGFVYHCLSEFNNTTIPIEGGIVLNTPITTDYSPERYNHYRPLYLKNLALEFIDNGVDTQKWQEAYDWMEEVESINTLENSKRWNSYVDSAFDPKERKTSIGMVFRVLFSKPYNPFKYFNHRDNKLVSDLIWTDQKNVNFFEQLPKINHPVLVITGRFDDVAGPEEIQKAEELLKYSKTIILPNAGHESFLDQPKLFEEAIFNFINNSHESKSKEKPTLDKSDSQANNLEGDLQIIDISQKQLALYNQHVNTDSALRVNVFRDSLYYPHQEIWDNYLGKIETFDAVAEHYGIRIIDQLNEKNKLFYSRSKEDALLDAFFEVRDGMIELTGHSPKGKWYLFYGPSAANLGSVGEGLMFVDFGFPDNKDLPSVINWFPHELNHLIYSNLNKDTARHALELCINEGLAVYVNKLYWNTIGGKKDYSVAMTLSYSKEELAIAEQEWPFILSYFKENYLSVDQNVKNNFGSRSSKLKENLPGAIGYLIGYKIIESYVKLNGLDSWKDCYTLSLEELLEKSKILKE